jgi:hypothetical protein
MLERTFSIFVDSGGILIADPDLLNSVSKPFLDNLDGLLDPDFRASSADTVEEPDDPEWTAFHKNVSAKLAGKAGLLIACEGDFELRIQAGEPTEEELSLAEQVVDFRLDVRTGGVLVADCLPLLELEDDVAARSDSHLFSDKVIDNAEPDRGVLLEVPSGVYLARAVIHGPVQDESFLRVVGQYGIAEEPAIVIYLMPDTGDMLSPVHRVDTSGWEQGYTPGSLAMATFTSMDGPRAAFKLHLTRTTQQGFARTHLPKGRRLKPGEEVLLRLVANRGKFWDCELPNLDAGG